MLAAGQQFCDLFVFNPIFLDFLFVSSTVLQALLFYAPVVLTSLNRKDAGK